MSFITPKKIVGIEIHENSIRAAVITRIGRSGIAERLLFTEAPSSDPADLVQALSSMVDEHKLTGMKAALVINDPRILHRAFVFPRMSLKELRSVVPLEAQKEFGVREDDAIIYETNALFKEEGLPRMEVLTAVVPSGLVNDAMQMLEQSGLVPCHLVTVPMAERFAPSRSLIVEEEKTSAILHITRNGIHVSAYHGERFLFSRMLKKNIAISGSENESAALPPESPVLELEPSDMDSTFTSTAKETEPLFEGPLDRLSMEVQRSFLYVKQHNREPVQKVWVSGEGAAYTALRKKLEKDLELPLLTLETLPGVSLARCDADEKEAAGLYNLCLGASLFPSPFSPGNLLPDEEQSKRKKLVFRKAARFCSIAAAVLLLLLYAYMERSLKQIRGEFYQFQTRMNSVDRELDQRTETVHRLSEKLVKAACVQGLSSKSSPFEDVLIVLSLNTPSRIVLDELTLTGGGEPFATKILGKMILPDLSSGEQVLDNFLKQLKSSGVFKSVRGHLGSGSENGESGLMNIAASESNKKIPFQVVGD